jgi:hypothetical protein
VYLISCIPYIWGTHGGDNVFRSFNTEDEGTTFLQNVALPTRPHYAGPSGRSVWGVGLDRLDADTVGSSPA